MIFDSLFKTAGFKPDGIALAGGGGKGAYQVGVLQAMLEYKALDKVKYISGTSVGALNAVLFATKDIQLAKHIWTEIVDPQNMMMQIEIQKNKRFYISREPLKAMINAVDLAKIKKNKITVFVNVYNKTTKRTETVRITDFLDDREKFTDYLLASSAIPGVYEPVTIDGNEYSDGGFVPPLTLTQSGNNPVDAIADAGAKNIMLVSLESLLNPFSLVNNNQYTYENHPFELLKPSVSIGEKLDGTIDFSAKTIEERMTLGYNDGLAFMKGEKRTDLSAEDKIFELAKNAIQSEEDFSDYVNKLRWKNLVVQMPMPEKNVFSTDIYVKGGWKIQQCKTVLTSFYWIIDKNNTCRAWTASEEEILQNLKIMLERKSDKK